MHQSNDRRKTPGRADSCLDRRRRQVSPVSFSLSLKDELTNLFGFYSSGTIISGDSVGNVHFWDAKSCARLQTIRAHRADVLCIVASPDGRSVFTSGVDQKTCQLTLNIQTQKTGVISQSRWLLSATRRLHSHNVRALKISPPYNPLFSSGTIHPSLKHPCHGARLDFWSSGHVLGLVPSGTPSQSPLLTRCNTRSFMPPHATP